MYAGGDHTFVHDKLYEPEFEFVPGLQEVVFFVFVVFFVNAC